MALEEKDIDKVSKNFYKVQRFHFCLIGAWPAGKKRWQQRFHYFQRIHVSVVWYWAFLFFEVLFLLKNISDLDKVAAVLFLFVTQTADFMKYISLNREYEKYQTLIKLIHNKKFQPTSAWGRDVLSKGVKSSIFARNFYFFFGNLAVQALCIHRLLNGSYNLPFAAYYPIDMEKYFVPLYVYQYIGITLFYCYLNVSYDTWTAAIQAFVRCQVEYLAERLRNIGLDTNDEKCVRKGLLECIHFHREILNLVSLLESVMKLPFTVQIVTSSIVLCLTFYRLSTLNPLDNFGDFVGLVSYLLAMLVQIFLLCYFGDNTTSASERLPQALYDSNWYDWDVSNKKLFLMALHRFNKPIQMNAIKLYTFDLKMFSSILNVSYTYFALLRRTNN